MKRIKSVTYRPKCFECGEYAVFERVTQFAGVHPYCDKHAREEEDFMENNSYHFWREVKEEEL